MASQFHLQKSAFEELFDDLRHLRSEIAQATDHENYRSYKFKQLARFDYTPQDCLDFHSAIRQEVLPLLAKVHERKCNQLGVSELNPWDLTANATDKSPLRPIQSEDELVEKAIQVLYKVDVSFGDAIKQMYVHQHLDLEVRSNKRPGGYQMPLPLTGIPFIFMNAGGSIQDIRTFMHESGHAVHSFSTNHLQLMSSKHPPVEIAELAAMSMELLSMDKWSTFLPDAQELRRAQIWLLENILQLLPWIAIIDRFQHWIYTHPAHTSEDRQAYWLQLLHEFKTPVMNYQGLEEELSYSWYKQLHLFEAPFYYIEYGIAQLGAIAIWKNYKEKGRAAVDAYKKALKLGYTRSIKEVYEAAGIQFDFSASYLHELMMFLQGELDLLWAAEAMDET
jgi:oligoendopeptidase F